MNVLFSIKYTYFLEAQNALNDWSKDSFHKALKHCTSLNERQLRWDKSDLHISRPIRQACGLISIRRNQSWKVEAMVTEWVITKGRNLELRDLGRPLLLSTKQRNVWYLNLKNSFVNIFRYFLRLATDKNKNSFFFYGTEAPSWPGTPHYRDFTITLRHTSHSVGLLWTSARPDTETSTWQHTTLTRDRHPCPRRESNPQSQQASGRRPTP
jgi:hypothetical protein